MDMLIGVQIEKWNYKNSSVDPDNNGDRWYFSNPKKEIDVVKQ